MYSSGKKKTEANGEHVVIKKLVKFYGTEIDSYGMPNPYYSYLVISSRQENMSHTAVASAISISHGSPQPNPPHFAYSSGDSSADVVHHAFCELINSISEMKHIKGKNLVKQVVEFNA